MRGHAAGKREDHLVVQPCRPVEQLVVTGDETTVADAVRDACVDLGIGIRRMQRRTATLEDVFLAAGAA